jgi:hypothetical protein
VAGRGLRLHVKLVTACRDQLVDGTEQLGDVFCGVAVASVAPDWHSNPEINAGRGLGAFTFDVFANVVLGG